MVQLINLSSVDLKTILLTTLGTWFVEKGIKKTLCLQQHSLLVLENKRRRWWALESSDDDDSPLKTRISPSGVWKQWKQRDNDLLWSDARFLSSKCWLPLVDHRLFIEFWESKWLRRALIFLCISWKYYSSIAWFRSSTH